MKRLARLILLALICLVIIGVLPKPGRSAERPTPAKTGEAVSISRSAEQLYNKALRADDLWWQPGESGIHLQTGVLVQNASPGCGRRDNDAGVNSLELRGRNSAGVEGMTSGLVLECNDCNQRPLR